MASTVASSTSVRVWRTAPSFAQTATPARKSPVSASRSPLNSSRPAWFSAAQLLSDTECEASRARTTSTGCCDVISFVTFTRYVYVTFTSYVTFSVVVTFSSWRTVSVTVTCVGVLCLRACAIALAGTDTPSTRRRRRESSWSSAPGAHVLQHCDVLVGREVHYRRSICGFVGRLLFARHDIEPHAHAGAREGQGEERDEEPVALQPQRVGALAARRAVRARRPQLSRAHGGAVGCRLRLSTKLGARAEGGCGGRVSSFPAASRRPGACARFAFVWPRSTGRVFF